MSDFLLVPPPDWVEIPNVTPMLTGSINETDIRMYIDSKAWEVVESFLNMYSIPVPEGKTVAGAQLMNLSEPLGNYVNEDGDAIDIVHRMWVLFL